jgi:hypothetical protein
MALREIKPCRSDSFQAGVRVFSTGMTATSERRSHFSYYKKRALISTSPKRRQAGHSAGLPSMELLSPRQHLDDRLHPLLSGFRLLRGLEPVSYGIQIGFVERFKESLRLLVFSKLL